jgi:hypothetical protein
VSENTGQWVKAFAVVLGLGTVGFLVGRHFGYPAAGAIAGLGAGFYTNYRRKCPVCMEHLRRMQARA